MRIFIWLLRATIFFSLFAFALKNQHAASVKWFFASELHSPMVFILLAAFVLGGLFGVLAMVPSWWRYRNLARKPRDGHVSQTVRTVTPPYRASRPPKLPPPDGL